MYILRCCLRILSDILHMLAQPVMQRRAQSLAEVCVGHDQEPDSCRAGWLKHGGDDDDGSQHIPVLFGYTSRWPLLMLRLTA